MTVNAQAEAATADPNVDAAPPAAPLSRADASRGGISDVASPGEGEVDELAAALELIEGNTAPEEGKKGQDTTPKEEPAPVAAEAAPEEVVPSEDTPPKEADTEPRSRAWASVTRAQKELETQRQQLKAERHRWSQEQETLKAQATQDVALADKFRQDPLRAMEEMGLPFTELAKQVATGKVVGGTNPPQAAPVTEDSSLAKEVHELKETIRMQQVEAQVNQYRATINDTLANDKFSLLRARGDAPELVMQAAQQHMSEYGEVLPPEEFAVRLQEAWEEELSTLKSSAAVRQVLGLATDEIPDEPDPSEVAPSRTAPRVKPISNQMSAAPTATPDLGKIYTEEDEIAAAAKLIPKEAWDKIGDF